MAEDLQSLLTKINEEGVKRAEAERARILAEAKAEAEKIVSAAKTEAEQQRQAAAAEAENLRERGESAVKQAARDVLLELRAELERRLKLAIDGAAREALTPALMTEIVRAVLTAFAANPNTEVTIRTAVADTAALDAALRGALAGSFRSQPRLFPDSAITGGLEVEVSDSGVYFDFTDEAISALVTAYAGPRLAELLK